MTNGARVVAAKPAAPDVISTKLELVR